ncbi:EamA family transporter [Salinimicrobium sp. GXAS 041]|uniref:EamA family transporter n=1 Tax=Salinimicrobium sp. GXAS 041 TaxID=3400806 RepID=UPI003C707733
MSKASKPVLIILAFFATYVIWGSTYLLNKIAVTELPPFMLASIRFTTAGILIFILAKISGKKLRITRKQLTNTIIAGFLFLSFGNGVAVWALRFIDSGFAALVISAQPLMVLLLMWLIDGKKIKSTSMLGVGLGLLGIYLLLSQKQVTSEENSILGILMIFGCLMSWAYGSIFVSKANLPSNYFVNTGYQMFTAGILLMIASYFFKEEWSAPATWTAPTQWSMILLIFFGSIIAFTSFNYLLKVVSPEKVATSTYVNPVIAMFLGWYFLNEDITTQSIVAAGVLLTGVFFINTKKKLLMLSRFTNRATTKSK